MTSTKVRLPAPWFAVGYLPPRCARHGDPATGTVRLQATTAVPPACYLLLLLGLVPFVIVVYAVQKKLVGAVTTCPRCAVDRRNWRLTVAGCWVAVIVLFLAGAWSAWMVLVGAVAFVVALVVSFSGGPLVAAALSGDQGWVDLRRVSPEFATEVTQGLARAQQGAYSAPPPQVQPAYQEASAYRSHPAYQAPPAQPATPTYPSAAPTILPGR